jgi:hypothetical protein
MPQCKNRQHQQTSQRKQAYHCGPPAIIHMHCLLGAGSPLRILPQNESNPVADRRVLVALSEFADVQKNARYASMKKTVALFLVPFNELARYWCGESILRLAHAQDLATWSKMPASTRVFNNNSVRTGSRQSSASPPFPHYRLQPGAARHHPTLPAVGLLLAGLRA